jgi:hypothetical protein
MSLRKEVIRASTTNWDWFQDQRGQSVYSIMGPRYVQIGLIFRI